MLGAVYSYGFGLQEEKTLAASPKKLLAISVHVIKALVWKCRINLSYVWTLTRISGHCRWEDEIKRKVLRNPLRKSLNL